MTARMPQRRNNRAAPTGRAGHGRHEGPVAKKKKKKKKMMMMIPDAGIVPLDGRPLLAQGHNRCRHTT
jgi:hypothetical protein